MARARNIKPAFFDNDELAELEPLGRLLFIGLWTLADYKGDLEWRDKRIKKQLLAYDDCNISELAINLDKSGFIRFYSDGDKTYLNVSNFSKHQNPHKNERDKGSDIPELTDSMRQAIDLNTLTINRDLSGLKRNGSDSHRADSLNLIPDSLDPDSLNDKKTSSRFAEFWGIYGKKTDSKKCEAKFKKLTKQEVDLTFKILPSYIASTPDKQFRKNPLTWLNGKCWNDEAQTKSNQQRNINDIGTDFSAPDGFKKMIFGDNGEMLGYE